MKIKCIRKVQSKSENPQRLVAVQKFHAYEWSEFLSIRKFSAYGIFWIYGIMQMHTCSMGHGHFTELDMFLNSS